MTAIVSETLAFPGPLARARRGDHDAFAGLVEQHEAMVFSLALRFFSDRTLAEEIAQDVFLQMYRSLDAIESESHLVFWLRQVTTRRCIDRTRRNRFRAISIDDVVEPAAEERRADPLLDQRIRRFVSELPETQRVVLTLRYQEDLDPAEICRVVGLPVNTVKSHLHRALQSLRRKLETRK
jgi:RNA polymerase sigma-70 factor (ECF subfamily)